MLILKHFTPLLFLLLMGFGYNVKGQDKIKKDIKPEKLVVPTILENKQNKIEYKHHNPIVAMKQILDDDYRISQKKGKRKTTSADEKKILIVGWFDTEFNKISTIRQEEMISIVVLTKGYAIGDTIRVTIDAKDNETLMAGNYCHEITFLGTVNHENLAFLQNIFCVRGDEELLFIDPKWNDRYICK